MSKIEWTDETWNPVSGCTWKSPGCDNCYAAPMTRRLEAMGQVDYAGLTTRKHFNGRVRTLPDKLDKPLRWKKPRMVFVNSMSDLFHPDVPDGFIVRVLMTMLRTPQHTYQILTKRPDRMAEFLNRWSDLSGEPDEPQLVRGPEETRRVHPSGRGQLFAAMLDLMGEPPAGCAFPTFDWMEGPRWWPSLNRCGTHIWWGTSVEDQQRADERIPHLIECPVAVRFLSCEPLLGPVEWMRSVVLTDFVVAGQRFDELIHWVIAGGESGPRARPMHPGWAMALRDQSQATGVPFFFKQWGAWCPDVGQVNEVGRDPWPHQWIDYAGTLWESINGPDPVRMRRVGKKQAGRLLDGREWNEFPQTEGSRNVGAVT